MKLLSILAALVFSNNLLAASNNTCHGLEGLWIGKFSYKDLSLCQLKYPELCNKVSIAIGIKTLSDNTWVADLYPQRGVATSISMTCENGRLIPLSEESNIMSEANISYQCDDQDNCLATYEDSRLKAMLVKMWTEDIRM